MGRAGGGSSGGSHRSGGSHSSSRSSGSHRISSSSSGSSRPRSRSSSSSSSSGGSSFNFGSLFSSGRGSYNNYGRTYNNYGGSYNNYGGYGTGGFMGNSSRGIFKKILIIALAVVLLFVVFKGVFTSKSGTSTIVRNKVESGISYDNNVVLLDETGWITQKSKLGPNMRKFYDLTGVQPYIVMLEYNEEYSTDKERESYADTLYDKYIDRNDALLFVYFGEEDIENDVGLMCYVLGHQAGSVFDEEAINIWYGKY